MLFLPPVSALSLCVPLSPACSVCVSCLFVLRPGRLGCLGNVCLEMSLPHAANSNSNKSNNNSSKGLQRPTQYVSAFNPGLPAATAGHRKGKEEGRSRRGSALHVRQPWRSGRQASIRKRKTQIGTQQQQQQQHKIRYQILWELCGACVRACVSCVHVIIEIKDIPTSERLRNQHESIAYR